MRTKLHQFWKSSEESEENEEDNKENKSNGVKCRSCGYFNPYASPDKFTKADENTCYACIIHPDRRFKNLPYNKRKDFLKYYQNILEGFYKKESDY